MYVNIHLKYIAIYIHILIYIATVKNDTLNHEII